MDKTKKILFIVPHRLGRSPGQRFRFEQYLDFLEENGFSYDISNIIDEKDDVIFYGEGNLFRKFLILLKSLKQRWKDIKNADQYDIVFIYREALMVGTVLFERMLKKSKAKIIFDFDDAIWLPDVSQGNSNLAWLKKPQKTNKIIRLADCIIAGNAFLADYAKQFNSNVNIIPTTIDTNYYLRKSWKQADDVICIGWTGSTTTLKHFETAIPFLIKLKNKYKDKIHFRLISDVFPTNTSLEIEKIKWNKNTEVDDLSFFDIGIMPLPDDEWSKGKCGFKGLQYMALEIPAVMSPVGVNKEIIQDGENGFLAESEKEWIEKISLLIESKELRAKFCIAGRKTILEKYSFESMKYEYLKLFEGQL